MKKSNLHTHTDFSDGLHSAEENILSAIEKGFVSVGISDHSLTDFDLSYCMKKEREKEYVDTLRALADKYRGKIQVFCGLELDGASDGSIRRELDYIIGDCHYVFKECAYHSIDHSEEGHLALIKEYFDSDPMRLARAYFETYVDKMIKLKPDILGHFDLVAKYNAMPEESREYQSLATEALLALIPSCPIFEMNTGAVARGIRKTPYPADYLLRELKLHGGKIVLSSDSHDKNNLDFAFDRAVEILKAHGFESVLVLEKNGFVETAI